MTTTTSDDPAGSLQHLPPRKRLMAQIAMGKGEDSDIAKPAPKRPKENTGSFSKPLVPPPEVLHVLHEKNKMPRKMIPESDVIKAARARAAAAMSGMSGIALSMTAREASEIKASAKVKGDKAKEARQVANKKAEAAKQAAATASELARLAEEVKQVAAGLEKQRAARVAHAAEAVEHTNDSTKTQKPVHVTAQKTMTDDDSSASLARRLHSEMNHASPRRGRRAAKSDPENTDASPPPVAPSPA